MSAAAKFLIGLGATIAMGWLYHGPLGHGKALIDSLEQQARQAIAASGVPGIEVHLDRHPLSRAATLSGPADDFQRNGMGSFPGLNQRVLAVDGISSVTWANPAPAPHDGNR